MSKLEILEELPRLSANDRAEIFERLWSLEESSGPTAQERAALDEAQEEYELDPTAGAPWSEVEARLRAQA